MESNRGYDPSPQTKRRAIYALGERERGQTLQQVADNLGVSKERVRQYELIGKELEHGNRT